MTDTYLMTHWHTYTYINTQLYINTVTHIIYTVAHIPLLGTQLCTNNPPFPLSWLHVVCFLVMGECSLKPVVMNRLALFKKQK